NSGITYMWRGHNDNLTIIRRIGQHFLIPSHRRVKHHLAGPLAYCAKCLARPRRSVFKGKQGRFSPHLHSSPCHTSSITAVSSQHSRNGQTAQSSQTFSGKCSLLVTLNPCRSKKGTARVS